MKVAHRLRRYVTCLRKERFGQPPRAPGVRLVEGNEQIPLIGMFGRSNPAKVKSAGYYCYNDPMFEAARHALLFPGASDWLEAASESISARLGRQAMPSQPTSTVRRGADQVVRAARAGPTATKRE